MILRKLCQSIKLLNAELFSVQSYDSEDELPVARPRKSKGFGVVEPTRFRLMLGEHPKKNGVPNDHS